MSRVGEQVRRASPSTYEEAAEALRESGEAGLRVRPVGGGTKLGWGVPAAPPDLELATRGLDRVLEHNAGDLTAVVQAGLPLARAQEVFADAGQMLALDPPLGEGEAATVGGIVATADSGPLRHRYGSVRDLVIGITVVLSDGTIAKAGGKVIKNVAGYDLAKLFTGSFGTLGLIVQVAVRLHPLPRERATATGRAGDPSALARAASALAHSPLETESLDVEWREGEGAVHARFGGHAAAAQVEAAVRVLAEEGVEAAVADEEAAIWERQRAAQRSRRGTTVRVSGLPAELPRVLRAAERARGSLVGRAGLGLSWIALPPAGGEETGAAVADLRRELEPFACTVLDAPADVRARVDVWGVAEGPEVELMRRVKRRFDAHGIFNPGIFVDGV